VQKCVTKLCAIRNLVVVLGGDYCCTVLNDILRYITHKHWPLRSNCARPSCTLYVLSFSVYVLRCWNFQLFLIIVS